MAGFRPLIGLLSVAIVGMVLLSWPPQSDAAGQADRNNRTRAAAAKLDLAQVVSIAVSRNLRMADSRLAVQEKEHQRREAFSDFFPSIDLSYTATADKYQQQSFIQTFTGVQDSRRSSPFAGLVTRQIGVDSLGGAVVGPLPVTGTYPYRIDPYRQFSLVATITQPLYTGGKLLNDYKYTRLGVDYSAIQFEVDRQDLILDVYQAYYQMVQAQKLLEVAETSIRALQALKNQTTEFYKAGVVAKVDVLSTEGQLAQAMIQRTQAITDREKSRATLNLLLRYPQESPTQIVEDIAYRPNPYRVPEIYSTAAGNRLEIRQANISVDQAMALVQSSKADLLPSVSVQAMGSRVNDDWNTFDPEAANDWRLQGVLSWSFDIFRRRETVKERRASQARAFVAREQLVEQVMQEVKSAYLDMKRSESDIQNNRAAVEYRRENFRINQERYKEQVATYIEVLDAQRQLSQAEGDYYISLVGYRINRAALERKMGTLRR